MLESARPGAPGVGTKFTLRTSRGEKVSSVVHLDGMREIYHWGDEDEEPHVLTLNDEEARQLGDHRRRGLPAAARRGPGGRPQGPRDGVDRAAALQPPRGADGRDVSHPLHDRRHDRGDPARVRLLATPHPDEVLRDTMVVIGRPDSFDEIRRLVAEARPTEPGSASPRVARP